MSFWCPFVDAHLTIHHSNIGVHNPINIINSINPLTLMWITLIQMFKVDMPNLFTYLNNIFVSKWYVVRCCFTNGSPNDIC